MKVESTPINLVNGNTTIARKPADNPVIQDQSKGSKEYAQVEAEQLTPERLSKVIEVANDAFKDVNVGFKYSLDRKINREVVQVVNTQTGEVLRQFPPKEIVNMLTRMYDMLGILVDEKM
ncbi:MAG TPA: flagellar protein FlaG [Bacillota bacterium]|nr:flagellar protein FlaG [Bacillota bacterium]